MKKILILCTIVLSSCAITPNDIFLENIEGVYISNWGSGRGQRFEITDGSSFSVPGYPHSPLVYQGSYYTLEGIFKNKNNKYIGIRVSEKGIHFSGNESTTIEGTPFTPIMTLQGVRQN